MLLDRKGEWGTLNFGGIFLKLILFQQEMPCVLFLQLANVANDVKTAKRRISNDSRNGGSSVTESDKFVVGHVF